MRAGRKWSLEALGRRSFATAAQQEQQVRPYKEIPGPRAIPIFGNKFRFIPGFSK